MDKAKISVSNCGLDKLPKAYSYVRFSTPEQQNGDSLRRQIELSEKYAKDHGSVLDSSLQLQDFGKSAYSGKHRSEGALGQFLKMVEMGTIEKGSILLVESLDRLSREQITTALNQFLAIISKDIKIVTLHDNREYSNETINSSVGELIISLTIMARAHEESAIKAMRLGKAWENKRKLISTKKLTARCPAWLQLAENKNNFTIIPGSKQVISKIFEMKIAGKGATAIMRELNTSQDIWMPKGRNERKTAEGWRESYIKKILKNPAVIGEYQPNRLVNGRRQPIGEIIPDYYPALIDRKTFYQVQEQIGQNLNRGGQTGKVSNLFAHIVKCGYCGGPLAFVNKGATPKGGQYLICDRARRGLGCSKTAVKYKEVERLILLYCKGLQAQNILDENNETVINILKSEHDGIIGELTCINQELDNLADSIATTSEKPVRDRLIARMEERTKRQTSLILDKDNLKQRIDSESRSFENVQTALNSQKELIKLIESEKQNQKSIDVRLKLRNELKKLIYRIEVYPEGISCLTYKDAEKALEDLSEFFPEGTQGHLEIQKYYQDHLENPKHFRFFKILFKTGSISNIYPEREKMGVALGFDFDKEEKIVRIKNTGLDGRIISEIYGENKCIIKHYRRSKDINDKEVLHEIIDKNSDKAQVIADSALKYLRDCK